MGSTGTTTRSNDTVASGSTGTTGSTTPGGTITPGMESVPRVGMGGNWSGSSATTASTDQAAGAQQAISCEQLIPRAVRRQYLANMTITPMSDPTDIATLCRIEGRGVDEAASVQAVCADSEADTAMLAQAPSTPVAKNNNLGKAAILVDDGELQQLVAWDSDSSCQITIAVPRNVDAVALGRRMLDVLPAKRG